jgi:O-antigen ligase
VRKLVLVCVCLTVFLNPWEEIAVIPGIATLSRIAGGLAIFLAVLSLLQAQTIRRWNSMIWLLIAFVAWNVVSLLWTVSVESTLLRLNTYGALLALAWLIYQFAPLPGQQAGLLCAYVAGSCVSTAMMFLAWHQGLGLADGSDRYTGGGIDCNELALMLSTAISAAFYLASTRRKPRLLSWLAWGVIPVFAFAILLTGSRGGAAAMLAMLLVLLLFSQQTSWKVKVLFILLLALTALLVFAYAPAAIFDRLAESSGANTFQMRQAYWKLGLAQWMQSPLCGVGCGAFADAIMGSLSGLRPLAHNTYISVLTETGVIGLGIFILLLLVLSRCAGRLPPAQRCLSLSMLAVWIVGGVDLTLDYKKSFWLVFALIAAQSSARAKENLTRSACQTPPVALAVSSGTEGLGYAD